MSELLDRLQYSYLHLRHRDTYFDYATNEKVTYHTSNSNGIYTGILTKRLFKHIWYIIYE